MSLTRIFAMLLSFAAVAQVLAADEAPSAGRQTLVLDGANFKLDASVLPKSFIKRSVELAREQLKANARLRDEV